MVEADPPKDVVPRQDPQGNAPPASRQQTTGPAEQLDDEPQPSMKYAIRMVVSEVMSSAGYHQSASGGRPPEARVEDITKHTPSAAKNNETRRPRPDPRHRGTRSRSRARKTRREEDRRPSRRYPRSPPPVVVVVNPVRGHREKRQRTRTHGRADHSRHMRSRTPPMRATTRQSSSEHDLGEGLAGRAPERRGHKRQTQRAEYTKHWRDDRSRPPKATRRGREDQRNKRARRRRAPPPPRPPSPPSCPTEDGKKERPTVSKKSVSQHRVTKGGTAKESFSPELPTARSGRFRRTY